MSEKRYYWLKLKEDYFNTPRIKKLRKIAGGDTYTIIYLKMQLLSIKTEGYLIYEGIESTFEEELALKLDEDLENVKLTLSYLNAQQMLEQVDSNQFAILEAQKSIGSEGQSAERVRAFRERKEQKALRCNDSVTDSNDSALRCNDNKELRIKNKNKELRIKNRDSAQSTNAHQNKSDDASLSININTIKDSKQKTEEQEVFNPLDFINGFDKNNVSEGDEQPTPLPPSLREENSTRENSEVEEFESMFSNSIEDTSKKSRLAQTANSEGTKAKELFDFWNEQKLRVHKIFNKDYLKNFNKVIKQISFEKLKECIKNYAQVVKDPSYFWTHIWSLHDFIDPKNERYLKFAEDGDQWLSYKEHCRKERAVMADIMTTAETKRAALENGGIKIDTILQNEENIQKKIEMLKNSAKIKAESVKRRRI